MYAAMCGVTCTAAGSGESSKFPIVPKLASCHLKTRDTRRPRAQLGSRRNAGCEHAGSEGARGRLRNCHLRSY